MAGIRLSGLMSGMDTESIIQQLVEAKKLLVLSLNFCARQIAALCKLFYFQRLYAVYCTFAGNNADNAAV